LDRARQCRQADAKSRKEERRDKVRVSGAQVDGTQADSTQADSRHVDCTQIDSAKGGAREAVNGVEVDESQRVDANAGGKTFHRCRENFPAQAQQSRMNYSMS
jgi:hypothetical protein